MPIEEDKKIVFEFIDELRAAQRKEGYYPRTDAYQKAIIQFYQELKEDGLESAAEGLRKQLSFNGSTIAKGEPVKALIGENIFRFARKIVKHHVNGGLISAEILQEKEPKWSGKFADCMHAAGVKSKEGIKSAWNFVKKWAVKIADTIVTKVLNARLSVSQAIDRAKLEARAFWRDAKAEMGSGLVTAAAVLISGVERAVGAKYAPGIQGVGSNLRGLAVESSLRSRVDAKERSSRDRKSMEDYHGEQRQANESMHNARRTRWSKGRTHSSVQPRQR
jgi:hypothetical protein